MSGATPGRAFAVTQPMPTLTEYRIISESEGWITESDDKEYAQKRAAEMNAESSLPDDHYVEEHTEHF